MGTCGDCKFFEDGIGEIGLCFGHEAPASRGAAECPTGAFQAREVACEATCGDCQHFVPHGTDPAKGLCFGHEVPASMHASDCPTSSYASR